MSIIINIVKSLGNICEIIYYKMSIPVIILVDKWKAFWKDYKRSVKRITEPRYIVDDSHKYSSVHDELEEPSMEALHTTSIPIIQKEKGFI